ncbi:MAG: hypothetical protein H6Q59_367 [Firmicutes bacterium]|nr:hypothetical protein [Bacillota bacterium]
MAIKLSGLSSGMDTESIVAELMSAQRLRKTKVENKKTKTEWKQDKWKDLNKKLYSFYTGSLYKMKLQSNFTTKSVESSDPSKVAVTASSSATEGNHQIKVANLASAEYVTGAKLGSTVTSATTLSSLGVSAGTITLTNGTTPTNITVDANTTIDNLVSEMKKAGINASFDATQKRFFLSSKSSGTDSAFALSSTMDLAAIGLGSFTTSSSDGDIALSNGKTMSLISAKSANFEYNGAVMTSSTNNVTVNGLSFTLLGATGSTNVSINVKNDKEAVFKQIKGFVKEYNDLITEMNDLYYSDPAKGFEPLTDDQKSVMSKDQIDKWESKIKDSLLRRDENLSSLVGSMRSSLSQSITYDNKSYSLSSFGVKTGNYTEKGLLHIDGDTDDSTVSAKSNLLMKALEENPDAVAATFAELAGKLYSSFTESSKSSSLRSAFTFYNDKEIKKQIDDYKGDLSSLENKLSDIESRYYKQFSLMEKAMSKMNSQSSNLASMLGTKG